MSMMPSNVKLIGNDGCGHDFHISLDGSNINYDSGGLDERWIYPSGGTTAQYFGNPVDVTLTDASRTKLWFYNSVTKQYYGAGIYAQPGWLLGSPCYEPNTNLLIFQNWNPTTGDWRISCCFPNPAGATGLQDLLFNAWSPTIVWQQQPVGYPAYGAPYQDILILCGGIANRQLNVWSYGIAVGMGGAGPVYYNPNFGSNGVQQVTYPSDDANYPNNGQPAAGMPNSGYGGLAFAMSVFQQGFDYQKPSTWAACNSDIAVGTLIYGYCAGYGATCLYVSGRRNLGVRPAGVSLVLSPSLWAQHPSNPMSGSYEQGVVWDYMIAAQPQQGTKGQSFDALESNTVIAPLGGMYTMNCTQSSARCTTPSG